MKRSPLARKTPLKRGESTLKRSEFKAKPLKPKPIPPPGVAPPVKKPRKALAHTGAPQKHPRPAHSSDEVGPLTPAAWREEVWRRCGGRCVMTGVVVPLNADMWTWQAHHCVPKQALPDHQKYDPRNGVVLSKRAHERHETATERVPAERLPASVFIFAEEVGGSAPARLARQHPAGPAAGMRGTKTKET